MVERIAIRVRERAGPSVIAVLDAVEIRVRSGAAPDRNKSKQSRGIALIVAYRHPEPERRAQLKVPGPSTAILLGQ